MGGEESEGENENKKERKVEKSEEEGQEAEGIGAEGRGEEGKDERRSEWKRGREEVEEEEHSEDGERKEGQEVKEKGRGDDDSFLFCFLFCSSSEGGREGERKTECHEVALPTSDRARIRGKKTKNTNKHSPIQDRRKSTKRNKTESERYNIFSEVQLTGLALHIP